MQYIVLSVVGFSVIYTCPEGMHAETSEVWNVTKHCVWQARGVARVCIPVQFWIYEQSLDDH